MSESSTQREAIADALRAVVPEGWSVLPAPVPNEPVPSIIVGPDTPYQQRRLTFRGSPVYNYRLTIITGVTSGASALDTIDAVLAELLPIFDTMSTVFTWESVSTAGDLQTRGGKDVVVATIPIAI